MALLQEQLLGGLAADLKVQYDAATGTYFVLRNGLLVPVPYYEIVTTWVAGTPFIVTHNLGVVPRLIAFEVVAKVAIAGLTVGQSAETPPQGGFGTAGAYGCEARLKTATQVTIIPGAQGLACYTPAGASTALSNAQVDVKVKVWGM